jgi:surfeit locus 1 family protein
MVQRGWVQRNFVDRERLPPVETPAGVVQVIRAHCGSAAAAL